MMKKIIAVFTGNRAEYGLQFPVLKAIDANPNLEYRLIVSGAHLDKNFGNTIQEINDDGFEIHAEVDIMLDEDSPFATSQAIGTGVLSIADALAKIQPDIFVVYADRFEGFAAVIAATQMNIPTAHIEGGDITEGGALDDSVRHAMTKLAHIHFTTNQQASNRLLAMGEAPWRVHTVGFPAIDLIQSSNYATPNELVDLYNLDLSKPVILFTQHSVTTEFHEAADQIKPALFALKKLALEGNQIIITYPNNDAGGRKIIDTINDFSSSEFQGIKNIQIHSSLGRYNYHGILALAANSENKICCVGNSSSGIKETPAFGCPTVNIGSRQEGRLRAENVIEAKYDDSNIYTAIESCLYDKNFRETSLTCNNPYGIGDAGIKIAQVLDDTKMDLKKLLRKEMTLSGVEKNGWYQ
jgi:UDP-N-acetylglucosamine 2-epimerase (non-hydrolysing)/GDP/UDP-N,N'-diacetylbacillosamine 2-epimerase (hydrolysing)